MLNDLIRPLLYSVDHQTLVREIAKMMKTKDIGCILVCYAIGA